MARSISNDDFLVTLYHAHEQRFMGLAEQFVNAEFISQTIDEYVEHVSQKTGLSRLELHDDLKFNFGMNIFSSMVELSKKREKMFTIEKLYSVKNSSNYLAFYSMMFNFGSFVGYLSTIAKGSDDLDIVKFSRDIARVNCSLAMFNENSEMVNRVMGSYISRLKAYSVDDLRRDTQIISLRQTSQ